MSCTYLPYKEAAPFMGAAAIYHRSVALSHRRLLRRLRSFTPSLYVRSVIATIERRNKMIDTISTADAISYDVALYVLGCSVMSKPIRWRYNATTLIVPIQDGSEFTQTEWTEATSDVAGEYDWWYGNICDGFDAYVITTKDADGNIADPDWEGLPQLLRTVIVARLRSQVQDGAGATSTH